MTIGRRCVFALILIVAPLAQATAAPVSTIRNNGDSARRIDLVILGDGYTAAELLSGKYAKDVEAAVQGMFAQEPYKEYQRYFNVQRVDVASPESGVDHPERSVYRDTAFEAYYNCAGIQRLICVDNSEVNTVVAASLAVNARDVILVLVNDSEYGGSGGALAVASTHVSSVELVLHEVGHSFGLLADEYTTQPPTCNNAVEPSQVNATREVSRALIKWTSWIASGTPVPTPGFTSGLPGLYEGARYCPGGLYRPTFDSKMRTLGRPFEQINSEQHVKRIYNLVEPIDSVSPVSSTVTIPAGGSTSFVVTTPLPWTHSLTATWRLDGTVVGTGAQYQLASSGLASGSHTLEVTVRDTTALVRTDPGGLLLDSHSWTVSRQSLSFTDHPLSAGTAVKAVHITELRTRVNGVRKTCGLAAASFADPVLTTGSTPMRAAHVHELRTALAAAYAGCKQPVPVYTDSVIAAGALAIKAVHIRELRDAVIALE